MGTFKAHQLCFSWYLFVHDRSGSRQIRPPKIVPLVSPPICLEPTNHAFVTSSCFCIYAFINVILLHLIHLPLVSVFDHSTEDLWWNSSYFISMGEVFVKLGRLGQCPSAQVSPAPLIAPMFNALPWILHQFHLNVPTSVSYSDAMPERLRSRGPVLYPFH